MKHYKIKIKGKVQGVWYRGSTKRKAEELGLKGFVQNQSDGSVITYAKGETSKVQKFIDWCHKGSPASSVESVYCTKIENSKCKEYSDFRILR